MRGISNLTHPTSYRCQLSMSWNVYKRYILLSGQFNTTIQYLIGISACPYEGYVFWSLCTRCGSHHLVRKVCLSLSTASTATRQMVSMLQGRAAVPCRASTVCGQEGVAAHQSRWHGYGVDNGHAKLLKRHAPALNVSWIMARTHERSASVT